MKIDMVFTYCDGSDPLFIKKKSQYTNIVDAEHNPIIRFQHINEINYSVQSVLKFLPWINTIYIVTDNQVPELDQHVWDSGKIKIIDHTEIIPSIYLPTFYSDVIESYLHNIPNLSEIFLYNNDDCFHMDFISESELFDKENNKTFIINSFNYYNLQKKTSEYSKRIIYTSKLLNQTEFINNHFTKICRVSVCKMLETMFEFELEKLRKNKFRCLNTIQYMFLLLNLDHKINNNHIIDSSKAIEYHFGNHDYTEHIHKNKFIINNKYKFACYNSMNYTYYEPFTTFIKKILS